MRSDLSKECRRQFRKMMALEFPDYHEDKTQAVPQGWYVWTKRHSSDLFFHILLVISPNDDEFTTEAAWDRVGRLPNSLSFVAPNDREKIWTKPIHFRTENLWHAGQMDHWWTLVARPEERERDFLYKDPIEDCLPLLTAAISEAQEKLKEFVLPVFEQVARRQSK